MVNYRKLAENHRVIGLEGLFQTTSSFIIIIAWWFRQLGGPVVLQFAAVLKVLGSNPGRGAQE